MIRRMESKVLPNLVITVHTDRLFTERTMRSHAPRATPSSLAQSQSVYQFFDPERPALSDINHLLSSGIPIDYAKLINKVNVHDRNLSLLGILPNQLRTLLKLNGDQDVDIAFQDISKTIFWCGYSIWCARKKRIANFWKNIAPEEWKPHKSKKNKSRTTLIAEKCTKPFHFLERHSDLSHTRPSQCPCSNIRTYKSEHKFVDIRLYFNPTEFNNLPQCPENKSLQNVQHPLYKSRADLIRGAHDRGKKRSRYV